MTRRSATQRMAAWLMAALLALVVGEPLRVHECPMHLRSVTASGAHHDAVVAHDVVAHDVVAHGADNAGHTDDHQGSHGCDCLGTCCTVAPVTTPRTAAVRTSVVRVHVSAVSARVPLAVLPAREHLLPFAIGPPPLG